MGLAVRITWWSRLMRFIDAVGQAFAHTHKASSFLDMLENGFHVVALGLTPVIGDTPNGTRRL